MSLNRTRASILLIAPLIGAWTLPDFLDLPPVLEAVPPSLVGDVEGSGELSVVGDLDELSVVVDGLQARYESITDYSADFVQENTQIALGETTTARGQVYFLRPGMMRWDYVDPEKHLIIDGTTLWSVEPTRSQYYAAPIDEGVELPSELRFLMGEGQLRDDFDVTLLEESTAERAVLDLVPRDPGGSYARILFVVSRDDFEVRETTIVDALGNTNTIRFVDPQYNTGFSAESFRFEPDETMTRIQPPE